MSRGLWVFAALLLATVSARASGWDVWQAYAAAMVDAQGRVIDHQGGDRTTSEGQAYAMFFALVANDRPRFDALLNWTRDNLAGGDLAARLPGWLWGKAPDGTWRLLDKNAAADADLWMSYTLFEAGRLWRDEQYTAVGSALARRIAAEEVAEIPGLGTVLMPGPEGFHPQPNTWLLNPSYMPLPVLVGMSRFDPTGPWGAIAKTLPQFMEASARKGFAMDWVSYTTGSGCAPAPAPGQTAAAGSYDAVRVYLWAGMAPASMPGSASTLHGLSGMAAYLGVHDGPPERVSGDGEAISARAPIGFSAAMLPYLDALGRTRALEQQRSRVVKSRNANGLYGQTQAYYDQNLVMFGLGWEQRLFRFGTDGGLRVTWTKA